jgi:hypothetical protein
VPIENIGNEILRDELLNAHREFVTKPLHETLRARAAAAANGTTTTTELGVKKRQKMDISYIDDERVGFPSRYNTVLTLYPYSCDNNDPPTTITCEHARQLAEEGLQPPTNSASFIEYKKNEDGNLLRDDKGNVRYTLKVGKVIKIGQLLQESVPTRIATNGIVDNHHKNLLNVVPLKRTIQEAHQSNIMEVIINIQEAIY